MRSGRAENDLKGPAMRNRSSDRAATTVAVAATVAFAALALPEPAGHAQTPTQPGANEALLGIPEHDEGERVLEQVLPEEVGTPSQDAGRGPAAGDLGDGFDAEPTGPLGRASEAPLGRAGAAGGGGAIVGESYGGGGVQVDSDVSGGGGVEIDRRRNRDLTPGLSGDGASPGVGGGSGGGSSGLGG